MTDETKLTSEFAGAGTPEALTRFATLLRRGARMALLLGLVAGLVVFVSRTVAPSTYTATVTLLLASPQQGLDSLGIVTPPPVDASAYRTLLTEGPLLELALVARGEAADSASVDALRSSLQVSIESQQISSVIRIEVTDQDAVRATELANLLASQTVDWDRERGRQGLTSGIASLERSVQQLQNQVAAQQAEGADTSVTAALLTAQQNELAAARSRLEAIVVAPLIDVLRFSDPVTEADARQALLYALIAFVLAAIAVYAVLFVRMLLNQRLRSAAEASNVTRLPVLSVFPGAGHRNPERAERDAADILRASLLEPFDADRVESLVILVTTAESSSGRRSVSTALAESFGRAGHSTLLVDANLRQPSSGEAFGLRDGEFASLEKYLIQPDRRLELIAARRDGIRMFSLMPSFRPADWPADLLRGSLPDLIQRWRRRFKVIILETAPILPYPDTLGIAHIADRALLVAGMGRSDPDRLQAAADSLRKFRANMPSLVLIDTPSLAWQFGLKRDPAPLSERYSISVLRAARRESDTGS